MKTLYLVTGAAGHLGSTLVQLLSERGEEVRGLILPGETPPARPGVRYFCGDVREKASLRPFFGELDGCGAVLVHTAGIVDIGGTPSPHLREVNVGGTQNILALCREAPIRRLVYVSSVHAIPEGPGIQREAAHFSPDRVEGAYAKTKAEATQLVLDAAHAGLDAVVVHPSGIIGPNDPGRNHLIQLIRDYRDGRLPACVQGGYDFVDVRDVAEGCLLAAARGQAGACYILSGQYSTIAALLALVRQYGGGPRLPVLPVWAARAAVPFITGWAALTHRRPLYTAYSLYTLTSNGRFSHEKASAELGYAPRPLEDTVQATLAWLSQQTS